MSRGYYGEHPFKLKNPRKGTETFTDIVLPGQIEAFQIKESPEGDWNKRLFKALPIINSAFKLKNPRKGTETFYGYGSGDRFYNFQIKESPEGDWNAPTTPEEQKQFDFQIKESPEGDWNAKWMPLCLIFGFWTFKLKNPRKGTETSQLLH